MALPLICDEHIPYPLVEGLRRRGLDVVVVQQIGLGAAADEVILAVARQQRRIVYTQDTDFLRHHAAGVRHSGILYHHPLAYSVGEALRTVVLACEVYSLEGMDNRLEYL
jgi:uncharacterized protein with PIN domain